MSDLEKILTGITPGPWEACNMVHHERGDSLTPEELGEYVANTVRKTKEDGGSDDFLFILSSGGKDICHIGNGPDGPHNAMLIAAAPVLLAERERLTAERDAARAHVAANRVEVSKLLAERGKLREAINNHFLEILDDDWKFCNYCLASCDHDEVLIHNPVNGEPCLLDGMQPNQQGETK